MKPPAFDQAAFQATMARLGSNADQGKPVPGFDPVLHRDVIADSIKGRKIVDYKIALESMGFRFIPPDKLTRYPSGEPHTEGEWRNPRLRMAFTEHEVLAWFASSEEFVTWVQRAVLKKQMRRSGLVMPPR